MLGRPFILIPILWQAGALTTYLRLGPISYDSSYHDFLLEFDRHREWLEHGGLVQYIGKADLNRLLHEIRVFPVLYYWGYQVYLILG